MHFLRPTATLEPIVLLLLSKPISAFIVEGWIGQRCSGEEVFGRTLGVQDGCVTTGSGQVESVTIQRQNTDLERDLVAFYSTESCDVTKLITTTPSAGCSTIDDTGRPVYKSFNVLRRA